MGLGLADCSSLGDDRRPGPEGDDEAASAPGRPLIVTHAADHRCVGGSAAVPPFPPRKHKHNKMLIWNPLRSSLAPHSLK